MEIDIRLEIPQDYREVENVTREAFWNLHTPGCDEHYFAHILRESPDFIPELDFVAEADGRIVGSIMFTHSHVERPDDNRFETITFGPLSVLPTLQKHSIGGALVRHALTQAKKLGYKAVLIYGDPAYYRRFGFRSAKTYGITSPEGRYPAAHQALELMPGALDGVMGIARESEVFNVDQEQALQFDAGFPPKERKETEGQKRFMKIATKYL